MQNLPEQNATPNVVEIELQQSFPRQLETWSGRLAMLGFTVTITVIAINSGLLSAGT
jgi:hypothetical protein